jgi:hypothetical protein
LRLPNQKHSIFKAKKIIEENREVVWCLHINTDVRNVGMYLKNFIVLEKK